MTIPEEIKDRIKTEASALGFILCGVTTMDSPTSMVIFKSWLAKGYHGDMQYLSRLDTVAKRTNPVLLMPEARSIIVLAYPYPSIFTTHWEENEVTVAAYAKMTDYHAVIPDLARQLMANVMNALKVDIQWRVFSDSSPVLEHDLAYRAGIGWIGKNSLLLHPQFGSGFLLAEIFIDVPLNPDPPLGKDFCGTCQQCIDRCPTQCIHHDRTIDAARCISYLTIEKKDDIPEQFLPVIGSHFFGCDICQQVCPWNVKFNECVPEVDQELSNLPATYSDLISLLQMNEDQLKTHFKGSSMARSKRSDILRNACIVLGNSNHPEFITPLRQLVNTEHNPVIKTTAEWAIRQLSKTND